MKKHLFLFFAVSILLSCSGKTDSKIQQKKNLVVTVPIRKIDKNNLIGFACYNRAEESEPVKVITKLLEKKAYNDVKEKLWSKSVAEKYLATIICKKLQEKNILSLQPNELSQIKENMLSDEKLEVCSGCTYEKEFSLKELFSTKTFMSDKVSSWLKRIIK